MIVTEVWYDVNDANDVQWDDAEVSYDDDDDGDHGADDDEDGDIGDGDRGADDDDDGDDGGDGDGGDLWHDAGASWSGNPSLSSPHPPTAWSTIWNMIDWYWSTNHGVHNMQNMLCIICSANWSI